MVVHSDEEKGLGRTFGLELLLEDSLREGVKEEEKE